MYPKAHYCKNCGKEIFPTLQWAYKLNGEYYCSWHCFRVVEKSKPKRKVVLPEVGDTILILRMAYAPSYAGKKGVVESIDYLGQLHGTWGKMQIIPDKDVYMIIKEETDDGQ